MSGRINVRVHNKKALELKLEYTPAGEPVRSDYNIDLLLCFPDNMGVNPATYEKRYFYYDLFRSIRLKSPDYPMKTYHKKLNDFDEHCEESLPDTHCIYKFKKLITGYRSMLRNNAAALGKTSLETDINDLVKTVHKSRSIFRRLHRKYGDRHEMFALGDEFTSIVTNVYLVRLYERLGHSGNEKIFSTIKSELKYRNIHFPESVPGDEAKNSMLITRYDYLKGYFFNVLSLRAKRKAGDKGLKSMLYATAAGISMVIATLIAFWAQEKYGNLTLPFFVALVVGYMFKDRIKDGFKSLLERLAAPMLYDYITKLYESTGRHSMGKTREKAGFITSPKLPDFAESMEINGRHILHFSKKVHIEQRKINELLDPEIHGITDIMRLNINRFTSVLEEPLALMYSVRNDSLEKTFAEKIYDVELLLRVETRNTTESIRGILTLSAGGIKNFRII